MSIVGHLLFACSDDEQSDTQATEEKDAEDFEGEN